MTSATSSRHSSPRMPHKGGRWPYLSALHLQLKRSRQRCLRKICPQLLMVSSYPQPYLTLQPSNTTSPSSPTRSPSSTFLRSQQTASANRCRYRTCFEHHITLVISRCGFHQFLDCLNMRGLVVMYYYNRSRLSYNEL